MRVVWYQKRQVVPLLCVFLLGLIVLTSVHQSREVALPEADPQLPDRTDHAFAVDKEISLIHFSESNQQKAPLIGKSLLSVLSESTLEPKPAKRRLITDRENYEVEAGKKHIVFYYHQLSLSPPSLQDEVNALRFELYSNPSVVRQREIRTEMNSVLKHAEFTRVMHEVILCPLDDASSDHDASHRRDQHDHNHH